MKRDDGCGILGVRLQAGVRSLDTDFGVSLKLEKIGCDRGKGRW